MGLEVDQGDTVRCSGTFDDGSTPPTYLDPTTVTFKIRGPLNSDSYLVTNDTATTTTYVYGTDSQLVKDGTGRYHVDFVVPTGKSGTYAYRFEGTGSNPGADEETFVVKRSGIYQ